MSTPAQQQPGGGQSTASPNGASSLRYLQNPNYYRLLYQLLVQYTSDIRQQACNEDVSNVADLRGAFSASERESGWESAVELLEATDGQLARLQARELRQGLLGRLMSEPKTLHMDAWGPEQSSKLGQKLTSQELRLQRFLAGTVEPCAQLLIAGWCLLEKMPSKSNAHIEALKPRYERLTPRKRLKTTIVLRPIPWSYRAFYNLACYAATVQEFGAQDPRSHSGLLALLDRVTSHESTAEPLSTGDEQTLPLWALREAFRIAPAKRLADLTAWAATDPALAPIREDPEFRRLQAWYSQTKSKTPG
jgi:hypothetical protein